jgi:hypothetical protein
MEAELIKALLPYVPPSIAVTLLTVAILNTLSDRRRADTTEPIRAELEELKERVKDYQSEIRAEFKDVRDEFKEIREILRFRPPAA